MVSFVAGIVEAVADWLPTWTLPGDVGGALAFAQTWNGVLPVTETLLGVSAVFLLFAILTLYRVVKIVASHIPLIGGSG